jgi:hypothetical protein
MKFLVLLFAMWPFHHKAAPPAAPAPVAAPALGVMTPRGLVHFPDSLCPHSDDGYFFLGPDGMIGLAQESCDAAFTDWRGNVAKQAPLPLI